MIGTTTTGAVSVLAVPTFQVQVVGGDNNGNLLEVNDGYSPPRFVDDNSGNAGTTFSILNNGSLVVNSGADAGRVAVEDSTQDSSDPFLVYAENAADLATASSNLVTLNCQLQSSTDGTCPLVCSANGASISYDCGVYWRLATSVPNHCYGWTPYAVGVAGT